MVGTPATHIDPNHPSISVSVGGTKSQRHITPMETASTPNRVGRVCLDDTPFAFNTRHNIDNVHPAIIPNLGLHREIQEQIKQIYETRWLGIMSYINIGKKASVYNLRFGDAGFDIKTIKPFCATKFIQIRGIALKSISLQASFYIHPPSYNQGGDLVQQYTTTQASQILPTLIDQD